MASKKAGLMAAMQMDVMRLGIPPTVEAIPLVLAAEDIDAVHINDKHRADKLQPEDIAYDGSVQGPDGERAFS